MINCKKHKIQVTGCSHKEPVTYPIGDCLACLQLGFSEKTTGDIATLTQNPNKVAVASQQKAIAHDLMAFTDDPLESATLESNSL